MHCVIETPQFARAVKRSALSEEERLDIHIMIAANPLAGYLIQGTGGARKLRVSSAHGGKRGGYRVITYYSGDDIPVFLLDIFSKRERVDLSQAERNEMRKILSSVADDYRASVRKRVRQLSEKAL